jgi:flavorubredoxin
MTYEPLPPARPCPPQAVGPDTWLIRQVQEATGAPLSVYINSLVIAGAEPVIVDTGTAANRSQWLEDVLGIVEPADVRWVFLSHEDHDHTGNLAEVMSRCPNATLVCSWGLVERFSNAFAFPLERCRWVNDGERFDAGDRTLLAVRPPLYDSPTTRGLLDERNGIYWGVDAFATPMPQPVATVADLDHTSWAQGQAMFAHHGLAPWMSLVDDDRYQAAIDRFAALGVTAIAGAHTPLIPRSHIPAALDRLRTLPTADVPPVPDQAVLDAIRQQVAAAPAA